MRQSTAGHVSILSSLRPSATQRSIGAFPPGAMLPEQQQTPTEGGAIRCRGLACGGPAVKRAYERPSVTSCPPSHDAQICFWFKGRFLFDRVTYWCIPGRCRNPSKTRTLSRPATQRARIRYGLRSPAVRIRIAPYFSRKSPPNGRRHGDEGPRRAKNQQRGHRLTKARNRARFFFQLTHGGLSSR